MKRLSRASFRLSAKDTDKNKGSELVQAPPIPPVMRDLQEFLLEAELSEYYPSLLTRLKVSSVEQLKYVREQDLEHIGMTGPEMRRLKKFYKKELPRGALSKLRKAILGGGDGASRTTSPSSPAQRLPQPVPSNVPYIRPPGRQLIPVETIQLGKMLGEGEFGVVQQGLWRTEFGEVLQVAVKRLSRERMNTGTHTFLKEAAIMQDVDHEHVVRMFGVVLDREDNLMLVTELAPLRSLLECLKDPKLGVDLPVTRLCDYAVQVCDGMSYLESKRMVHRDLAARNILVFNKNQVKISDLGLSRLLDVGQDYYQSKFSVSLKLPIAWCAPECINFLKFTSASDVWSFGVLLWEFFTYGFQPWAGLNGHQILQAIDEPNCQRLEQPDLCTNEMYKLMRECWLHDPEARPRFSDILLRLPQLRPAQVKAIRNYPSPLVEKGYIYYKAGDVIVVIDKSPVITSPPGLIWKGVLANGKSGLFDPTSAVPFIEPKVRPMTPKTVTIVRKESSRKSGKKIRADMISNPQNDLRHTGHIGYDGAVFGDVSFIRDNYDKLPVKAGAGSSTSHDSTDHNGHSKSSNSQDILDKNRNGCGQAWISQESLNSQEEQDGRCSPNYLDIEEDSLFSDFKIPDMGSSFDFGPSFMDEVLKALDAKEKQLSPGADSTPTNNRNHFFESNSRTPSTRAGPPVPAPRESRIPSSSSPCAPSLPAQPPRVEVQKEKKQAKVKQMSASEEKMVDSLLARARELTSHMIGSTYSPPVSPSQEEKSSFFDDETGIISRLKNSIKRSGSPRNEHKRTFSEELENKGGLDNEVTPEAQQAYNMLVVKGSFKEKSASDFHQNSVSLSVSDLKRSGSRASSKSFQEVEFNDWLEPDLIRESKSSCSPNKMSVPVSSSQLTPVFAGSPTSSLVSAPLHSQTKPASASFPIPQPDKVEYTKRSDIHISVQRPETQRVDLTVPASPDLPPKRDKQAESHVHAPAIKDREESKMMIKTVRVDDSGNVHNKILDKASRSLEHPSEQSLHRSFNHSNNTHNTDSALINWNHSECSSDSSKLSKNTNIKTTTTSIHRKESLTKKHTPTPFEEDLSAPSPQEIMSRLRERRLNRYHDQHKTLTTEGELSTVETTSGPESSAHGQNIEAHVSNIDQGREVGGHEEVDTNPLRMLRGGAIPIRTAGKGSAGMGNHVNRGAVALRVPQLNFSRHFSRSDPDHQKTDEDEVGGCASEAVSPSSQPAPADVRTADDGTADVRTADDETADVRTADDGTADVRTADDETGSTDCAVVEMTREMERSTLEDVNYSLSSSVVTAEEDNTASKSQSYLSQDLHLDLSTSLPPACASSPPSHQDNLNSSSKEKPAEVDGCCQSLEVPVTEEESMNSPRRDNLTPPRLPPRRSQSLNENSEKGEIIISVLPRCLRRSSSVEESSDAEAPALPPRQPHGGRTPLNARPRERRFPLQIHLHSPDKNSRQQPISPRPAVALPPTSKHILHLKSPVHTVASPTHLTPSHTSPQQLPASVTPSRPQTGFYNLQQLPTVQSPKSPSRNPSHRYPVEHNTFMSRSLDSSTAMQHLHHHHSNSVDLPPAYDLSVKQSLTSSNVADSEPTHMLLDLHTPHLPLPLSVSLPPSSDLTVVDEPTHVSLSSLTDNKHSWSATFTSPSPLSPSFLRRQIVSSHSHSANPSVTRVFDRSLSNEARVRGPSLYPDLSDNQSPPADLPPAPPTPSYREKLGLEQQKPKVARSISLNPHIQKCGSHFLTVDSLSSPASYRGRSASTNCPASRSPHTSSTITSPSNTASHSFHFPQHSHQVNADDDAFFAEAPSYPHPYSQSPFHPLVPSPTSDVSQPSSIYSTISFLQSTPDISPYQVSSAISLPGQSPSVSSRLDAASLCFPRRIIESHNASLHTQTVNTHISAPPVSPRTTSTHIYSTVSLPPSHQAPLSPRNSRMQLKNCATNHRTEDQKGPLSHLTLKPDTSQNTSSQVFKFPSVVRIEGSSNVPACSSPSAAQSGTHNNNVSDLSPTQDYPSSSEVSPLMFASYSAASSVSYEDLRQFALDRQKNCEEIETLLKIFPDQVTVEECMTALEGTQWDVSKATKYLQLKKLLSLGVADVHKCKEALSATGWDLQCAAETLLESSRALTVSSSSSSLSSSSRGSPARSGIITSHHRPASPEILDV